MKKKSLYIILSVITTIILFSTAAICNQCEIPFEIKLKTATDSSVEEAEDIIV